MAVLPAFEDPPVVEVILAVHFETLPALGAVAVTDLWNAKFRSRLPNLQEHPPVVPTIERFGRATRRPELELQILDQPPSPRYWFIDTTDTQLIQLQSDWFARNWRQRESAAEYPRYPSVREPFSDDLATLSRYVLDEGFGEVKPLQCEVTYINHLKPGTNWTDHGDLSTLLRVWSDKETRPVLSKPEQVGIAATYRITAADDDEPLGRLHINLQPGFTRADEEPVYVLTLTARGRPVADDSGPVLRFLDIGHEWIVRAFDSITSDTMHNEWRKLA